MFDIDKVFLSTLFRDAYGNTEFEDDILKRTANDLVKAYIAILKDTERSSTELNGSIDNDTLLIKEVVRDIFGKLTTTVQPYAAYTMRSQFSSKDEFINGKRGIGPFALNNNNHILTMLYGVEFKHKEHSLIDQLGLNSLHSSTDKDGKSIMSWLSGFINAHVDVAKDPYISKLNVNPYTYNLVSFLIRTGYGADTLYFTSQPIMRQLAEAYANATGKYMVDLTKSSFKLAEEAENTVLLDTINSYLDTNYADVNEAVNSWLSAKFDFGPSNIDTMIEAILKDNPDILRDIARNYIKHNGVYPAIYNVFIAGDNIQLTTTDVQILVALANQKFKPYATALSELVKYSKIDTKKEGKSVIEQIKYVEGYEGIFDQDNASGTRFMFDTESLDRLLIGSYIGTKTTNATLTFLSILGEQLIESTRYFLIEMRNLISSCPQLREYTTKDLKSVVGQLMAKIKSQFFFGTNGYATKLGIDVKGLVTGNNTIYDRLLRIEADLANDPQYKDLVDSDGNPLNYLLRNLVSGSKYEFLMPIRPANGTMADTYDHAKFVRPLSFMNDETVNADELSQAWDDLLRDTAHPELQKFAQDLIVYAFITSGDNGGRTDIFKYVPNSWKLGIEELGEGYEGSYAEYMSNVLNDYKAGRNMMTQLDYDSIILNNWHDSKYVPIVKLVENNEALFETWMNSPSGGFPIMLAGINRFGKAFDTQSKFIKIKRNHIAGEVNGQREYVIYERVGYGKRYITSTNDKGKVVISEVDYPVYMMVDPQGIKFSTLDKSFVLGYGQQPTQEARQQVLSQLSDLITMLNGIGANIVDGTGIDIVQQIINFADSKGKASVSVLAKFGMPLQLASIVEEMIQYNHPQVLQEKPSSVTYYSGNVVPEPNTIFVFGSNIEGRHGDGSAKIAVDMFGAQYGVAEGITGQAYALPTKDLAKGERSLTRELIIENIRHMYEAAKANPTLNFKVAYRNMPDEKTRNGYTGREMIEMFLDAGPIPSNVWFSQEWVNTGLFLVEYAEEGLPSVSQNTYPVPTDTRSDAKLVITPIQAADKKATAKGSISNKFIGFADGIQGSSTAEYARQAGDKANTGDYNANDVIFVSIPGKRGDAIVRSVLQELTIEEALKALEAGATLVTDNADYVASSDYNEGEKLLAESLQAAGATYSERTVDGQVLGIWKKLISQSTLSAKLNNAEDNENDPERFAGVSESEQTIGSKKTILSNEELKYWNEHGVEDVPRILVASERTDPAFHVNEILDILDGKKSVDQWGVVNGRRLVVGLLSGKDFAGLYLITKHDGIPMKRLLETKIPKLIHFSITGLGGTEYEPGVMKPDDLLDRINEYIRLGLDPESVTIRIDPIIPGVTTPKMIENIIKRASEMGIKRIRFSIMDAYPNTVAALEKIGYDFDANYGVNPTTGKYNFNAKPEKFDKIVEFMLQIADKYGVALGSCAENITKRGISKEGCLSVSAVNKMLGTSIEDKGTDNNELRKLCSCYGGKIDALAYGKNCASHCIYCYAKHENDAAMNYYNEDGTLKDNQFTRTSNQPFEADLFEHFVRDNSNWDDPDEYSPEEMEYCNTKK